MCSWRTYTSLIQAKWCEKRTVTYRAMLTIAAIVLWVGVYEQTLAKLFARNWSVRSGFPTIPYPFLYA